MDFPQRRPPFSLFARPALPSRRTSSRASTPARGKSFSSVHPAPANPGSPGRSSRPSSPHLRPSHSPTVMASPKRSLQSLHWEFTSAGAVLVEELSDFCMMLTPRDRRLTRSLAALLSSPLRGRRGCRASVRAGAAGPRGAACAAAVAAAVRRRRAH
jgi:hypothetical protein